MDNNGKEKVSWKSEYMSDKEGKKCRIMYFDENGEVNSYGENTYEYDKEGRIIRSVYYESGKEDSAVEYVYDDNGNCILETQKDADGKPVQIFVYKYEKIQQE